MVSASTARTWLGWVAFFFAWLFVVHGVGLVLHEVGGHGVAMTIFGGGVDRFDLTYFGTGQTVPTPWGGPTWPFWNLAIIESAGLLVTIGAGAVAMVYQRRAGLAPLTRLLIALLATAFLLHQLGYATSGGFHVLYDPRFVAGMLKHYGLHVLAWLPPLVLFAVSALVGARAIVDAFREHFGSRSRLHGLRQILATLGAAGVLFIVAGHLEQRARAGTPPPSVSVRAAQIAVERGQAPPFPIHYVLFAIGIAAFVLALARPVVRSDGGQDAAPPTIPRRYAVGVGGAALVCAAAITLLVHV